MIKIESILEVAVLLAVSCCTERPPQNTEPPLPAPKPIEHHDVQVTVGHITEELPDGPINHDRDYRGCYVKCEHGGNRTDRKLTADQCLAGDAVIGCETYPMYEESN